MPQTPANTVGLGDYTKIAEMFQQMQQQANAARVPNAAGLEIASSNAIAQLLNPGYSFSDVDRRAAELGAGRGIAGSEAAFGTGLRMTDEERLKRIAMGQDMLTAAQGRNKIDTLPPTDFYLSPAQAASDATNRYGIDTTDATNRYGIDTTAATAKYKINTDYNQATQASNSGYKQIPFMQSAGGLDIYGNYDAWRAGPF